MKVSRFDYIKQYELLKSYIGEKIIYKNDIYTIEKIVSGDIQVIGRDYNNDTIWTVCILSKNEEIELPIDVIFKICYPHLCWEEKH